MPERLVYLRRLGDALQCRLSLTSGKTVLQFAQVACEICSNRKDNHEEQEQENYSRARVRIRTRRERRIGDARVPLRLADNLQIPSNHPGLANAPWRPERRANAAALSRKR